MVKLFPHFSNYLKPHIFSSVLSVAQWELFLLIFSPIDKYQNQPYQEVRVESPQGFFVVWERFIISVIFLLLYEFLLWWFPFTSCPGHRCQDIFNCPCKTIFKTILHTSICYFSKKYIILMFKVVIYMWYWVHCDIYCQSQNHIRTVIKK